ncbi:MAG TPA: plastocyanin/azurin family copper-binding protein [Acidimicrobiales bacterium]
MTRPTSRMLLLVPLTALLLAACGDDSATPDLAAAESSAGDVVTVAIETFAFAPDPLEVDAGTTITFVNGDAIDHTVTAGTREAPTPEVFDGLLPEEGATFELTLDEAGTYDYFCSVHPGPGMTASITVR